MSDSCNAEKKPWEHPQLIVLVRNNPEEAVLGGCKSTLVWTGFNNVQQTCNIIPVGINPCAQCLLGTYS